jgi:hypothetical protein
MTDRQIAVRTKSDGRYEVRLGFLSSVINNDELRELFVQIACAQGIDLVHGSDSAEPCTRCGDNPRAWVRSTFCGSCISAQLREDLQGGCALDDVCEAPHDGCGAGCDGYGN